MGQARTHLLQYLKCSCKQKETFCVLHRRQRRNFATIKYSCGICHDVYKEHTSKVENCMAMVVTSGIVLAYLRSQYPFYVIVAVDLSGVNIFLMFVFYFMYNKLHQIPSCVCVCVFVRKCVC